MFFFKEGNHLNLNADRKESGEKEKTETREGEKENLSKVPEWQER